MTSVVRSRRVLAILGACAAMALAGASLIGQAPSQAGSTATDPALRLKSFDAHVAMRQSSPFKSLVWQFLGPTNISGRVTDVAVVTPRGKFYTIYVATATGGLWKTDNDGVTWAPVFDQGVDDVDWRRHDRAVEPQRRLVGHGRGEHLPQFERGRGRLPVD